jgi:hemerythrin-like domain-containing protein
MDEHKQILRALNILEQMASCVDCGQAIDGQDFEDILRFLKMFADEHHQGKEEAVLFPAMMASVPPEQRRALKQMIFEHDQERSLVEGMEDALRTRKGKDLVYFAQRLIQILRTHIYKEDHVLFELADKAFSREQDVATANELERYDFPWRAKVLDGLQKRLHKMEWKYLGRTATTSKKRYA